MNNKSIYKLVDTKKEYQSKLNEILRKYFIRYMKKLYEKNDNYKDFQYELLKIPKMPSEKITKEYDKFIKYTNDKYDLSEEELIKILDIIFQLNIKIMTSLFDEIELKIPPFQLFWLKCLKRIGKYYYENPKSAITHVDSIKINDSIEYIIQKYMPLKDIINSTHKQLEYYNFDKEDTKDTKYSNLNTNIDEIDQSKALDSSKNDNSLNYIKSEDFENEYYNSNSNKSIDKQESEEVKQINIPKHVYPTTRRKSFKKKNEIDENFFDNI